MNSRMKMNSKAWRVLWRVGLAAVMVASLITLAFGPVQTAEAASNNISFGQTVTGYITATNPVQWWEFSGRAGQTVTISMSRSGGSLDAYLDLWINTSSGWKVLASDDNGAGNADARIQGYQLPYSGTYVIGATRRDGNNGSTVGSYDMSLWAQSKSSGGSKQNAHTGYVVRFYITELTCIDGEEDDYYFSSGEDEIYLAYTLYGVDARGVRGQAKTESWGIYDMESGVQYDHNYFTYLELGQVPVDGGVGLGLALNESDDHSSAQKLVHSLHGVAAFATGAGAPIVLMTAPKALPALVAIEAVALAGDVSAYTINELDSDDNLGEVEEFLTARQLDALARSGQWHTMRWNVHGTNNTDDYSYMISYAVQVEYTH